MPGDLRITLLVDNSAPEGLVAEHGFAAWIEVGGLRVLFDTGQGAALAPNAAALGVDLSDADVVVLSHGHYDHGGALAGVLAVAHRAQVYAHPAATRARYSVRGGVPRAINIPSSAVAALRGLDPGRLVAVTGPTRIAPGVGLTGPIARATAYEDPGGPFFLDPAATSPDLIEDDQALWIATARGVVVVTGCGHAGVINTLRCAQAQSGEERVRAIIGGFHLVHASPARMSATAAALEGLAPALVAPCHCTSAPATEHLAEALGDVVAPPRVGTVFTFPAT
ncbi:MAG: MBL fold metallo-hydrolase [Deltaproteobacteria bacterium HGW-Deltaproteobacteria-14]|jgi:7,8-dihydropterin-6-yl-methyl-4-(beta-D-ribofuranosyl)aminobenzene 5'-phosphate synthase|nr:MAG: MBL fold metallo-hydrolase [Deltaproteobacteria bacterium HGW-Deltaproteobacteria-14]